MKIKQFIKSMILILSICFFSVNIVYWCKYMSEIDKCIAANDSWMNKSIDDFVCRVWSTEKIIYQIVLDKEFKKVDDEMDEYLEKLEINKNYYFWKEKKKNFFEWINDISDKKKYFRRAYLKMCWVDANSEIIKGSIINDEAINCTDNKKVSNQNIIDYFPITKCKKLVDIKTDIFYEVAISILILNKEQVASDDKKIYDQWQRKNYNLVLDIMMINLWYIERIWQKWPSKTWNAN